MTVLEIHILDVQRASQDGIYFLSRESGEFASSKNVPRDIKMYPAICVYSFSTSMLINAVPPRHRKACRRKKKILLNPPPPVGSAAAFTHFFGYGSVFLWLSC